MKILFVVRSAKFYSRYTSILQALLLRGHKLVILFDKKWSNESGARSIEEFKNQNPGVSYEDVLFSPNRVSKLILLITRSIWTYRRFLMIPSQSSFFINRWR